jgi:hypothetical protein
MKANLLALTAVAALATASIGTSYGGVRSGGHSMTPGAQTLTVIPQDAYETASSLGDPYYVFWYLNVGWRAGEWLFHQVHSCITTEWQTGVDSDVLFD